MVVTFSKLNASLRELSHQFLLAFLVLVFGGVQAAELPGQDHWAIQPLKPVEVPKVELEGHPVKHPVDAFVLSKLQKEGVPMAPEADRGTLIRRFSLVLLGLPPTAESRETYLHDPHPDAHDKLIDAYLGLPQFGERWARHWMDVVRYADTHGTEHDAWLPHAWRYRDYLTRAFNQDLPYSQLVREHIAGDLLNRPRWNSEAQWNESLIGSSWWRLVEFNQTPVDVKAEEILVADNQIDALSKAFLGLTVACARCHDHKFDPVSQMDWQRWFSILASTRTSMRVVDAPERVHGLDPELLLLKQTLRQELSSAWLKQLDQWEEALPQALNQDSGEAADGGEIKRWRSVLGQATSEDAKNPSWVLRPLLKALKEGKALPKAGPSLDEGPGHVLADFSNLSDPNWFGMGFLKTPSPAGDFAISTRGDGALDAIYPSGRYSHLLSDKHPGSLRSPNFVLTNRLVSVLVCGDHDARARLILDNFQGDSLLFAPIHPRIRNRSRMHWVTMRIRDNWIGHRAYVEIVPRDDMTYVGIVKEASKLPADGRSAVGIQRVVLHDGGRLPEPRRWPIRLEEAGAGPDLVKAWIQESFQAVQAWEKNECSDVQAEWLNGLLEAGLLDNDANHLPHVAEYRALEDRVPVPTRVVAVVDEGPGLEEPFFNRGDHRMAGDPVARGFLQHFLPGRVYASKGSGRLELAEDVLKMPLTSRVMVNRIWHHVFGAGIVRTTDNFGRLGDLPSHPELLDWLALEWERQGGSLKSMLRLLLSSRTFRSSMESASVAREKDPENRLLSHAHLRRLDGESLRDAILTASGRLDLRQYGPSVPVIVPAVHEESYSPVSGPVDGDGRRSLYLEVRRNHPSPFLRAFDQPSPVSPKGCREVTNVPAQSLTLLNDGFIRQQAEVLAKLVSEQSGSGEERVVLCYERVLGRRPSDEESQAALDFVREGDLTAWQDLVHALFNLKEFAYMK